MSSSIYRIRNVINNKCYYGSSANIEKRWGQHTKTLVANKHHNIHLQRAWAKYGEDNFSFEIVELVNVDLLLDVEQQYLDENVGGYNLAPASGGDLLRNHPDREAIIARRIEAQNAVLAQMTDEEKKARWSRPGSSNPNWRNGGESYKMCPTCQIRRIQSHYNSCGTCRDRTNENNPFFGKSHKPDTKEKIRQKKLGQPLSDNARLAITGENSVKFQGYYHTPWGVFPSTSQAPKAHPYLLSNTINTWCKKCDLIITRLGKSRYLQEIGESIVGKTYREIGFWFEGKGA